MHFDGESIDEEQPAFVVYGTEGILKLGSVELEYVSPVDDEPSYWKECLDRDGEGLHHLAFRTDNITDDMQGLCDMGCTIVQAGN